MESQISIVLQNTTNILLTEISCMKAMAFSEHGSVLEWVHKKNAIEKAGMKYIHAEEFYVTKELYQYPDDTELCESLLGADPEETQKEIEEFFKKEINSKFVIIIIVC